jgi:hypothetical protein
MTRTRIDHVFHWKHDPMLDIWTKGKLRVSGVLLRQLGKPVRHRKMKTLVRLAVVVSRPRPARPALTKQAKQRIRERIRMEGLHV